MTFRRWVQEQWYRHLDELEQYRERTNITPATYFSTYKWWLRREYRAQMSNKKGSQSDENQL